jgi:hypothetical protein
MVLLAPLKTDMSNTVAVHGARRFGGANCFG